MMEKISIIIFKCTFFFTIKNYESFLFSYSHYTKNSRCIIVSALKVLVPVAMLSVLNASPTFVERRLFNWISKSQVDQTEVLGPKESISNETLSLVNSSDTQAFNFANETNGMKNGTIPQEEMSKNVFQQLVDENLIFNIIQVFTLTIVPAFLLIYYNLRIFQGVIERQKLLIPRERIFNKQLKEKKKGNKKEYDLETTIEEWKKESEKTSSSYRQSEKDVMTCNAIKLYPTIGTFKHTTDLLTLPVTLPGVDMDDDCSSPAQRSSKNSITYCASNKRQYEDKLAFENMVSSRNNMGATLKVK